MFQKIFQHIAWKKTGFGVDYDAIDVGDIWDIHKYLMRKNDIVENVWFC